jgi:hypothetical protein
VVDSNKYLHNAVLSAPLTSVTFIIKLQKSVGVIYCIFCTKCNRNINVGQTGDTLYQRMLLNFSKIRTGKIDDPVANHFCQIDHSVDNFMVLGIDQVQGDKINREEKESSSMRWYSCGTVALMVLGQFSDIYGP